MMRAHTHTHSCTRTHCTLICAHIEPATCSFIFLFISWYVPSLFCTSSFFPIAPSLSVPLHLPHPFFSGTLPKVRCLTVALSKLVYSEVSKTAQRVYWEDLGEIHLGRRDRQKRETRKKNRWLRQAVQQKYRPQLGQYFNITIRVCAQLCREIRNKAWKQERLLLKANCETVTSVLNNKFTEGDK